MKWFVLCFESKNHDPHYWQKWMRTDFREERKWKMALAYNLSTAVLEWHAAGSLEERVKRRICVLWKRPRDEELDGDENERDDEFEQMDVEDNVENQAIPNPMVDYNSSDNDDEEPDPEHKDVADPLDLSTAVQDALDCVDVAASGDGDPQQMDKQSQVQPKVEERDDSSALHGAGTNGPDVAAQQDSQPNSLGEESVSKSEERGLSVPLGLKPTSTNPILASTSDSHSINAEASSSSVKTIPKSNIYAPMRDRIAYSDEDKLFIDLDDYEDFVENLVSLSTEDTVIDPPPPPPDLSSIFPDLQPFGVLNVPPAPTSGISTDAKKKTDRKSDRDDPNKRIEDTSYTKLVPLGEFMHCKPTLIGPLNPAKRWRNGKWLVHEDTPSNSENDTPTASEALCGKFRLGCPR